jgi:beta-glucosidase
MTTLKFPDNFLFGTATSAPQVEGGAQEDGKGLSIWDAFAGIPGVIADNTTPRVSCDMYHSWKQDLRMAKEMNNQTYRFSFSWSRILPEGRGGINQKGLDFYKRMVDEMLALEIVPNATVYHWDLPYALEQMGGWLNRDIVEWYGDYASILFKEFGDKIPLWSTINEPIATYVGYALGVFAPGRKLESFGRQANHHVLLAHGEGVKRFRQEPAATGKIGIVIDIWNHHPFRKENKADIDLAERENQKTWRSYVNPILKGCYTHELLKIMEEEKSTPEMRDGDMLSISRPIDFFGLNCYNRVVNCAEPELMKKDRKINAGGNFMDNWKEFYPRAIYDAIHILTDEYKLDIPIYITENGTNNCQEDFADDGKIHDIGRIEYIRGFLTWLHKAIKEGIDIRGYYCWSLLDNWEWSAGNAGRFGLVHTDFQTQERIWKDSAHWYKKVIETRGGAINE